MKMSDNTVFIRKWELKIGRNSKVISNSLPSGSKDYNDRKTEKDTTTYNDRYKSTEISSEDLTTVPAQVITLTDPLQIIVDIEDPKEGAKANSNKSTIKIYNLSQDTYKQIRTGDSIFLRAGYVQDGKDLPHVFIGQITKILNYPEYQDTITYIEANSSMIVLNAHISKSYPPNSTLKDIVTHLADAIGKTGVPLGEINSQPIATELLKKAYPSGYVAQGSPLKALESVCSSNGMRAYISQGRLHIEPKEHRGQLTKVVTVADGQFKGKAEEAKDKKGEELTKDDDFKDNFDLKLNLYLDGNITKDALVNVTAKGYEGTYSIKELQHKMDWKHGDWDTIVTLLKIQN